MNRILTAILLVFCMLCFTPGISMATTGGPDEFGYQYIDSLVSGGPGFHWIDISGTGSNANIYGDDVSGGPYNIGFNFSFYGTSYSQFYTSTNGIIKFGSGSSQYTNHCLPGTDSPANMIAVYWDDLEIFLANSAAVYYQYFSESPHPDFSGRCLVVMWKNANFYDGTPGLFSLEAILFEDGNILMQFGAIPEQGASSTTGIQNLDRTIGLNYSCNGVVPEEFSSDVSGAEKPKIKPDFTPDIIGPIPTNLAVLFGPMTAKEKPEDVYSKYEEYINKKHDDKLLGIDCFITAAAGEASGLFPLLMAAVCTLGGLLSRKRG
jgi:hypothetical protein